MKQQQKTNNFTSCSSDCLASAWLSDNGDSTFSNSLLWADYPDNDVIRVDNTYYMASTSMHLFPGCPILSSNDLIHWKYESYALPYDQLVKLANPGHTLELHNGHAYDLGAWASSIRYNTKLKKFYYLVNIQDGTLEEYAVLCVANSASGPWKVYRLCQRLYDPGLFFEEDGTAYVVHGQGQLYLSRLKLVDETTGEYEVDKDFVPATKEGYYDKPFYHYTDGYYNEGSHTYKVDDTYYVLSTPTWEGTATKKEICIQTKDLVNGPYVVRDIHTSFMKFGENAIQQGAIVDVPLDDGTSEWWSIIFQGRHKIGRTPTLQPVYWETDENGLKWPMIGEKDKNGEHAITTYRKPAIEVDVTPSSSEEVHYFDDFTSETLDLCWQWNHVPDDTKWSLTEHPGYMRLHTATVTDDLALAQNTLRQRVIGPESSATIKLDISHMADGDVAGLTVHQERYNYIGVTYDASSNKRTLVINDDGIEQIAIELPVETTEIWLRAHAIKMEYRTEFSYSLNGTDFTRLGGRYEMHYGIYVGMGFGAFNFATKSLDGYVDMDSFAIDAFKRNSNYAPFGSKIEAEHYDKQKYALSTNKEPSRFHNPLTTWTADYVYTEPLTKWGTACDLTVSNFHDGDWIQYNQIDLGNGAEWFNARISGTASGGTLEVHQGAPDGQLLATLIVPNTGDEEIFKNTFVQMDSSVTGIQKLCLVYHGPEKICRLNWFMFGTGDQPTPAATPTPSVNVIAPTQLEINWENVENALEYDIKLIGNEKEKIISNVTSPFCETGLNAESTYKIAIRSKNNCGYSEWSTLC